MVAEGYTTEQVSVDATVAAAIAAHSAATDPHGDRAYTDTALTSKYDKTGGPITGHVTLVDANLRFSDGGVFDAEFYRASAGALGTDASLAVGNLLTAFSGVEAYGGIFLGDQADPPDTPAGGGVLFVQAGALKYIGSSGTITPIANA